MIYIAFEGLDGSGKSTGIEYVASLLREAGREVHVTFEPGGHTQFARDMRQFIFDHINCGLLPETEVMLFQAVRNELYSREVLPALKAGKVVLSDRTFLSSIVYQGYGRNATEWLKSFLDCVGIEKPSHVLYFKCDVATALSRMSDDDPFKLKGQEYWSRVEYGYEREMNSGLYDVTVIDASLPLENVRTQLRNFVTSLD